MQEPLFIYKLTEDHFANEIKQIVQKKVSTKYEHYVECHYKLTEDHFSNEIKRALFRNNCQMHVYLL